MPVVLRENKVTGLGLGVFQDGGKAHTLNALIFFSPRQFQNSGTDIDAADQGISDCRLNGTGARDEEGVRMPLS